MIINKTFVALITSLSLTTIAWICFKILLDYISNQKTSREIRFITFLLCVIVSVISTTSLIYIITGFLFYKTNYKETLFRSVIITSAFWILIVTLKTIGLAIILKISNLSDIEVSSYN